MNQRDSRRNIGFLFLGNEIILDFLNTRPVLAGKEKELHPDVAALFRWFQEAKLVSTRDSARLQKQCGEANGMYVLQGMKKLREKLRREVLAWEQSGTVHGFVVREINHLLAKYPMLARLTADGNDLSIGGYFRIMRPEDLFAPLAHSAAALFGAVDRNRVRKCENCVLHFHDTSKKGRRRWCSMALCGNRAKVAAYVARRRRRLGS
jgi:predicted RNA-binding Zn ribbon-like protein